MFCKHGETMTSNFSEEYGDECTPVKHKREPQTISDNGIKRIGEEFTKMKEVESYIDWNVRITFSCFHISFIISFLLEPLDDEFTETIASKESTACVRSVESKSKQWCIKDKAEALTFIVLVAITTTFTILTRDRLLTLEKCCDVEEPNLKSGQFSRLVYRCIENQRIAFTRIRLGFSTAQHSSEKKRKVNEEKGRRWGGGSKRKGQFFSWRWIEGGNKAKR